MRKKFEIQPKLGAIPVEDVQIDKKSRDEIPKTLLGLQYIFCNRKLNQVIFSILSQIFPKNIRQDRGRRGMTMWEILVLACIRLACNTNYDHLKELADMHSTIREMLGLSTIFDKDKKYGLQTLKDNISLLTPKILKKINTEVVKSGHYLINPKKSLEFMARCDSFVTRTNVYFPTDIGLLFDAIRKVITLT